MDVAIRDAMAADAEGRQRFSSFDLLRDIGVSSLEIAIDGEDRAGHLPGLPDGGTVKTREGIAEVKARLEEAGVRAAAVLVQMDFTGPEANDPTTDAEAARVYWAVMVAHLLGAPVVRIDPLARDKTLSAATVRDRFVKRTEALLRESAGAGIDLGIENHGPYANRPAWLDDVLTALPDPRLGLTLDTGNFYWFGFPREDVYRLVEKYARRVKHTHVKNINFPPELADSTREVGLGYREYCCGVDEGNLDLRRVVGILRGAAYDRDLCIEDESLFKVLPDRRVEALRRQVRALRDAVTSVTRAEGPVG